MKVTDEKTQKIKNIEDKYGLTVFRCGLTHLFDCGVQGLSDNDEIVKAKNEMVDEEKNSKATPVMTAEFRCGILDCAVELSKEKVWDIIKYIKNHVTCEGSLDFAMCLDYESEDDPDWKGSCPRCGYEFNSELINEYELKHCPNCGQAIKTYLKKEC